MKDFWDVSYLVLYRPQMEFQNDPVEKRKASNHMDNRNIEMAYQNYNEYHIHSMIGFMPKAITTQYYNALRHLTCFYLNVNSK